MLVCLSLGLVVVDYDVGISFSPHRWPSNRVWPSQCPFYLICMQTDLHSSPITSTPSLLGQSIEYNNRVGLYCQYSLECNSFAKIFHSLPPSICIYNNPLEITIEIKNHCNEMNFEIYAIFITFITDANESERKIKSYNKHFLIGKFNSIIIV